MSTLKTKFGDAFFKFVSLSIALFATLLLIRVYEYVSLSFSQSLPAKTWLLELSGLRFDLLLVFKLSIYLLIPFILLSLIKPKIGVVFYHVMAVLIVSSYLGLVGYFSKSLLPLGTDLFAYSSTEIQETVKSGGIGIAIILSFLLFIALSVFLSIIIGKIKFPAFVVIPFYIMLAIMFVFNFSLIPNSNAYSSDFESFLVDNKLGYFIAKTEAYLDKKEQDDFNEEGVTTDNFYIDAVAPDITGAISNTNSAESAFRYTDPDYPFLHTDSTKDVLGQFFNKGTKKPNIVFIIVESLGRGYCGENAYLGSFTPFLDSLMTKSLYWENFLSTGGRTFAVLPSAMGSLPFSDKGFLEMGDAMPKHQSLLRLLKANGYKTSFSYGGDSHFDNMDIFLKKQDVNFILDEKKYGNGYSKLPASSSGFSWGYGDKELFKKSLELTDSKDTTSRLDVYLTVAMHSPFLIPEQDKYIERFEKQMQKNGLAEPDKEEHRKYKLNYSTMLYTDDAIRTFIAEYAKRPEFKNTIFVITGDHRMPEIPIVSKIDRFHVPLIIYSPLLKAGVKFSSVSTHFDITPSLLAFLRDNYGLKFPSQAHWIGHGLDVERSFRNIHSYPLMRNKNELLDYLDKDTYLADGQVFRLYKNMDIEPSADNTVQQAITAKFNDFKSKNNYACKNGKLLPDSVYSFKPINK